MADYDHGATLFEWLDLLSLKEETEEENDYSMNSVFH